MDKLALNLSLLGDLATCKLKNIIIIINEFVSPISGIYYLHLNAANQAFHIVDMQVVWNGKPYINVIRENTKANGTKTNGRAIMSSISAGDKFHVK